MDLDTGTRHFRTVLRWLIDELLRTHTGPIELLSYARPALTKLLSGRRLTSAWDRSGRGPSGSRRRTWRERAQRIRLGRRRKPGRLRPAGGERGGEREAYVAVYAFVSMT